MQVLSAAQVHAGGEGGTVRRPVPHLPADDDPGRASAPGTLCCHHWAGHDGSLEPHSRPWHMCRVCTACAFTCADCQISLFCFPCSVRNSGAQPVQEGVARVPATLLKPCLLAADCLAFALVNSVARLYSETRIACPHGIQRLNSRLAFTPGLVPAALPAPDQVARLPLHPRGHRAVRGAGGNVRARLWRFHQPHRLPGVRAAGVCHPRVLPPAHLWCHNAPVSAAPLSVLDGSW